MKTYVVAAAMHRCSKMRAQSLLAHDRTESEHRHYGRLGLKRGEGISFVLPDRLEACEFRKRSGTGKLEMRVKPKSNYY